MEVRILGEPLQEPFDPTERTREELDPDPAPSTRRRWLALSAAAFAGIAVGAAGDRVWSTASVRQAASLDWLDMMRVLNEDDLVQFAGMFELRAQKLSAADARLEPAFARLLDVAILHREPGADRAGAAAVQTLARFECLPAIKARAGRDLAHHPATRAAVARALGMDPDRR